MSAAAEGVDDVKVKAVNEMMERIKHGVVLRPVKSQESKVRLRQAGGLSVVSDSGPGVGRQRADVLAGWEFLDHCLTASVFIQQEVTALIFLLDTASHHETGFPMILLLPLVHW